MNIDRPQYPQRAVEKQTTRASATTGRRPRAGTSVRRGPYYRSPERIEQAAKITRRMFPDN